MTHETRDYIQVLHSKGYRVTPQRLIVLDAVCELASHASITDIQTKVHEMDATIDRSTIYRALNILTDAGLIVETEIGDEGKIYRIAGEAKHHHLVCQSCGVVLTATENILEPALQGIYEKYGFLVTADHL